MELGRATELLKRCGYRDTTLARIRDWVAKNPRKREYVLNPTATMQKGKTRKPNKEKDEK